MQLDAFYKGFLEKTSAYDVDEHFVLGFFKAAAEPTQDVAPLVDAYLRQLRAEGKYSPSWYSELNAKSPARQPDGSIDYNKYIDALIRQGELADISKVQMLQLRNILNPVDKADAIRNYAKSPQPSGADRYDAAMAAAASRISPQAASTAATHTPTPTPIQAAPTAPAAQKTEWREPALGETIDTPLGKMTGMGRGYVQGANGSIIRPNFAHDPAYAYAIHANAKEEAAAHSKPMAQQQQAYRDELQVAYEKGEKLPSHQLDYLNETNPNGMGTYNYRKPFVPLPGPPLPPKTEPNARYHRQLTYPEYRESRNTARDNGAAPDRARDIVEGVFGPQAGNSYSDWDAQYKTESAPNSVSSPGMYSPMPEQPSRPITPSNIPSVPAPSQLQPKAPGAPSISTPKAAAPAPSSSPPVPVAPTS